MLDDGTAWVDTHEWWLTELTWYELTSAFEDYVTAVTKYLSEAAVECTERVQRARDIERELTLASMGRIG